MAELTKAERNRRRDSFLALIGVRPAIMGILNVTPDSFSDGGRFQSFHSALAQARKLIADGADVIDVGAELTRPGHTPVPLDEEWRRLAPLLGPLLNAIAAPVSIDTSKAEIARRSIAAGVLDRQRCVGIAARPRDGWRRRRWRRGRRHHA